MDQLRNDYEPGEQLDADFVNALATLINNGLKGLIPNWNADNQGTLNVKPAGTFATGKQHTVAWSHNDSNGYLFHLIAGRDMTGGGVLAVGIGDENIAEGEESAANIVGVLISNKSAGKGLVVHNQSTTVAGAYAIDCLHESPEAVFLHMTVASGAGAPLWRVEGIQNLPSNVNLVEFLGSAMYGYIKQSGVINWLKDIISTGKLIAKTGDFVYCSHIETSGGGQVFRRVSGDGTGYYSTVIYEDVQELKFAGSDNHLPGAEVFTTGMGIKHDGTIKAYGQIVASNLPVYANEAAAVTGGLATNTLYKTATGELRVKL